MKTDRTVVLHAITDSISVVLIRGQLRYLKTHGFPCALLCSPGPNLDRIAVDENIPVFPAAMMREISPLADLRSLANICAILRRLRPVICNAGTPKAGLLVGLAAWLTRVPCRIYTLRGLRLETATGFKRRLLTLAERISCRAAHRVICVSASLRDRAVALNLVPLHKTVLLGAGSSNGVDALRFMPSPEKAAFAADVRKKLGIGSGQPVIGFAGRFTRDKGLPELMAAWNSVRESPSSPVLLLVGDDEAGDPVPAHIKSAIESDPRIYHVPFNPQIELYYAAMDLFVLPTHREGLPNTVLEAQASALPVITTFATGAVDSIEDGVTGILVPVGDSVTLADAILSLLSDPARLQSMGRRGRERVIQHFSSEAVWQNLASLYRTMLEERGYPSPAPQLHPQHSTETPQCAQVR